MRAQMGGFDETGEETRLIVHRMAMRACIHHITGMVVRSYS